MPEPGTIAYDVNMPVIEAIADRPMQQQLAIIRAIARQSHLDVRQTAALEALALQAASAHSESRGRDGNDHGNGNRSRGSGRQGTRMRPTEEPVEIVDAPSFHELQHYMRASGRQLPGARAADTIQSVPEHAYILIVRAFSPQVALEALQLY